MEAEGESLTAHVAAHPDIQSVAELSYIAIDEIGDGLVTLIVSQWPELDESGRLRFPEPEPVAVDVDRAAFEAHLKAGHFRVFNDASADLILRKHVTRCDLVCSGANVASRMGG